MLTKLIERNWIIYYNNTNEQIADVLIAGVLFGELSKQYVDVTYTRLPFAETSSVFRSSNEHYSYIPCYQLSTNQGMVLWEISEKTVTLKCKDENEIVFDYNHHVFVLTKILRDCKLITLPIKHCIRNVYICYHEYVNRSLSHNIHDYLYSDTYYFKGSDVNNIIDYEISVFPVEQDSENKTNVIVSTSLKKHLDKWENYEKDIGILNCYCHRILDLLTQE